MAYKKCCRELEIVSSIGMQNPADQLYIKKKVENIDYLKYLYSTDIFYLHVFLQVIHREKHFEAFGTLEHLPLIFARPAGHKSRINFTGVL